MRRIALLALLLAFAAAVYGQENILEKGLEGRSAADVISRRYVTPLRLVALPGELTAGVENPEALLRNFDGQLTTGTPDVCRLSTRDGRSASVLLDFGKELCGGIALSAAIRADQRALKVRIRLGESVSEAMSHERAFAARFYARRAVAGQCRGRELGVPLRADRPGGARCGAQSESRAGDPPLPRRSLSGVVPL